MKMNFFFVYFCSICLRICFPWNVRHIHLSVSGIHLATAWLTLNPSTMPTIWFTVCCREYHYFYRCCRWLLWTCLLPFVGGEATGKSNRKMPYNTLDFESIFPSRRLCVNRMDGIAWKCKLQFTAPSLRTLHINEEPERKSLWKHTSDESVFEPKQ